MTRRIFWSGGFDSTFLVAKALARGERVKAVALIDDINWQKRSNENEARARIAAKLPAGMLGRLSIEHVDMFADELAWSDFWKEVGRQREEAGRWTSMQNAAVTVYGHRFQGFEAGIVKTDQIASDTVAMGGLLTAGVNLPVIHCTKADMLREADQGGFGHLLRMSWTCEADNDALVLPCGECEPCRGRIVGTPDWFKAGQA